MLRLSWVSLIVGFGFAAIFFERAYSMTSLIEETKEPAYLVGNRLYTLAGLLAIFLATVLSTLARVVDTLLRAQSKRIEELERKVNGQP